LESRRLLSGAQINYPNFSITTGLVTNGYASAAVTNNGALVLTDGNLDEARSVLYDAKVPIDTFTSHFTFTIGAGGQDADGFTFVIDNGTTRDLGASGYHLAYAAGTFGDNSIALEFNSYNLGAFGSTFAFASGGVIPASTQNLSPLDLHSGDTVDATVTYNGTTLAIHLVDTANSVTFNASEPINLAQVLGGHAAYVGFTGATGNDDSTQVINSFDFAGTANGPTITALAASVPLSPTGTKAHLSVSAESLTGGTLTYNWSLLHTPSGAATPTFSANGTSGSNDTIAHFYKAGTYIFRVTVTDSNGGSSVSDVAVVVRQTPTLIKVTPHKAEIKKGITEQFLGRVYDQFGHALEAQSGIVSAITYAIVTGSGSIGASTGLYTASGAVGHLVVEAESDGISGVAGAVVVA
jgi:hypothetical protein